MPDIQGNALSLAPHKVIQFAENVTAIGQKKQSRLLSYVRVERGTFEGDRWLDDTRGKTEVQERTVDVGPTPLGKRAKYRRMANYRHWELGEVVGTMEQAEQLHNPANSFVEDMGYARERRRDQAILRAITGKAYDLTDDGEPTQRAFPAGQVIAVNHWGKYKGKADGVSPAPTGDSGLTVPKLRALKILLGKAQIMGRMCLAVEEEDLQHLMTSAEMYEDHQTIMRIARIADGEIGQFHGIHFVKLDPDQLDVANGNVELPAWIDSNIRYREEDITTMRVGERADLRYAVQAYLSGRDGGLRREDKGVAKVVCAR